MLVIHSVTLSTVLTLVAIGCGTVAGALGAKGILPQIVTVFVFGCREGYQFLVYDLPVLLLVTRYVCTPRQVARLVIIQYGLETAPVSRGRLSLVLLRGQSVLVEAKIGDSIGWWLLRVLGLTYSNILSYLQLLGLLLWLLDIVALGLLAFFDEQTMAFKATVLEGHTLVLRWWLLRLTRLIELLCL